MDERVKFLPTLNRSLTSCRVVKCHCPAWKKGMAVALLKLHLSYYSVTGKSI
jgi:hypothetical protein